MFFFSLCFRWRFTEEKRNNWWMLWRSWNAPTSKWCLNCLIVQWKISRYQGETKEQSSQKATPILDWRTIGVDSVRKCFCFLIKILSFVSVLQEFFLDPIWRCREFGRDGNSGDGPQSTCHQGSQQGCSRWAQKWLRGAILGNCQWLCTSRAKQEQAENCAGVSGPSPPKILAISLTDEPNLDNKREEIVVEKLLSLLVTHIHLSLQRNRSVQLLALSVPLSNTWRTRCSAWLLLWRRKRKKRIGCPTGKTKTRSLMKFTVSSLLSRKCFAVLRTRGH